ncbi:3' terminal RNA ribose 2'-O-methyltransferase Hen1 [Actinokineospora bangkokensis]|uniref:Small RNA 2'-O-methyltransferase n=1 Tax=Actinokineospora bangkokensis TaxID=1193682 RepID=A0A1Q9LDC7_9PSEU|nr:3' terminal RNA ribose 2'-O-methyltransferase Hen1 [Actinokineospora bangkokensis]OLR90040.1 3' terminal RNA ribose 2'-O-methyltransferase Hen1 [Actinokineospora bangkokensis]
MLLTMTTTHRPATDLGFLLFKHPDKAQSFGTAGGRAHVFYPRADEAACTAALLVEVDPVALVRGPAATLDQYVNDRPYAAGSMLAVALRHVFRTAMTGRCDARPELAATAIPLRVHLPAVACRGGGRARELFEPLGWAVAATPVPLDPAFPEWGDAPHLDLVLTGEHRVADALRQLYVLLPVLDGAKHYRLADDEVDKLLAAGADWLPGHPLREQITRRYLAHRPRLVAAALGRLAELDNSPAEELDDAAAEAESAAPDREPLAHARVRAVLAALQEVGARRVLDLGCGGGALLRALAADPTFTEVVGTDVAAGAVAIAARRVDRLPDRVRARVSVRQSSLTYADPSLTGYDAAVLMEVVEHVDLSRHRALEQAVFGVARPRHVVVTTPNVEHNALFETLPAGHLRHRDHRFEWTRAQFREWADGVCARMGYTARFLPVGPEDPVHGPPTQLAIFSLVEG